jgi:hypothetical protein
MTLTTRTLTPETGDDFAALVEANNGVWGGCWCIGFQPEGVGRGREENRELKRRHVTRGTVHQVPVYDGDRCAGWCQFGPPGEVATIKNAKAYEVYRNPGGTKPGKTGAPAVVSRYTLPTTRPAG